MPTITKKGRRNKTTGNNKSVETAATNNVNIEKKQYESLSGKFGEQQSPSSFTCCTIPNVEGTVRAITVANRQNMNLGAIALAIAPLLSKHPQFMDRDWNEENTFQELLEFLLEALQAIRPKNMDIYFASDESGFTPYWFYSCDDCYQYGNIIPCDWLVVLAQRHRRLYLLAIEFLSFCQSKLDMALWNDDFEEREIENIQQCIVDGDLDTEDERKFNRELTYYQEYACGHYHRKICNSSVTAKALEKRLHAYRPIKPAYKSFKQWMLAALDLYYMNFRFSDYIDVIDKLDIDYEDMGVEPYQYARFCWSNDGSIADAMSQTLDDLASNYEIIPLCECEPITEENITGPESSLESSKTFYDWMSDGHQITANLYTKQSS